MEMLQMTPVTWNPAFLSRSGKDTIDGIIGVLVNEKIRTYISSLSNKEDVASEGLPNKRRILVEETTIKMNGVESSKADEANEVIMNQSNYIERNRIYIYEHFLQFEDFRK